MWALGRMMPHIKRTIYSHPFIETESRDVLYKMVQKVYDSLVDASKRERGTIPLSPNERKKWDDGIETIRGRINPTGR